MDLLPLEFLPCLFVLNRPILLFVNQKIKKMKTTEKVTKKIVEMLETAKREDYNPFKKLAEFGLAENQSSGIPYNGINQLFLLAQTIHTDFQFNRWMTMKQANKLGGKIMKGSQSTEVVFKDFYWIDKNQKTFTKTQASKLKLDTDSMNKRYYLKLYRVFNIQQIENLPQEFYIQDRKIFAPSEVDEFVKNSGANISTKGINKAAYFPELDKIIMPTHSQFINKEHYFRVLLHELSHWTGHSSRLNRNMSVEQDSKQYAFEELIAELSSAILCGKFGIDNSKANAYYIKSWLQALENDKTYIFKASTQADKAVEFINNLQNMDLKKAS